MATRRTPSRASSRSYAGSVNADQPAGTTPNAALMGAALAFGRAAPRQRPANTGGSTNGSLYAAVSAGQRSKTSSPEGKSPGNGVGAKTTIGLSPNTVREHGNKHGTSLSPSGMPNLQVTPSRAQSRSPSGSTRATAMLAANRASPASEHMAGEDRMSTETSMPSRTKPRLAKPAAPPKPRRLSSHHRTLSQDSIRSPTDDSPILPTTSLVSLFERNSTDHRPPSRKKPVEPIVIKPSSDLTIRSPKPVRTSNGVLRKVQAGMADGRQAEAQVALQKAVVLDEEEGDAGGRNTNPSAGHGASSSKAGASSGHGSYARSSTRPSSSHRAAASSRSDTGTSTNARDTGASTGSGSGGVASTQGLDGDDGSSQEESYFSASEDTAPSPAFNLRKRPSGLKEHPSPSPPPPMPPPRRSHASPLRSSHHGSSAPIDIKLPTRSVTSPRHQRSPSNHSPQSITATYHQLYPRRMTPLSSNDLANAMVASSLASSRVSSPHKLEPPPVVPRHHHHLPFARTPSPAKKGMRHTLRKDDATSSDTGSDEHHPYGKHRKKRIVRKHPNKHHEGDRKRWRDAVTERERKRYEGVWAANRGLYSEDAPDQVSNIVVRDIWMRSRLPGHELEVIWDLVDSTSAGRLGKEEFVVGLWLIDQRLKGRKLPTKVSPTVWASVTGVQGIKVKKFMG